MSDLAAALRFLKITRKTVALGNHQAGRAGKKERGHVHKIEILTGLIPGERLIEIVVIENEVLAP